MSKGRLRRKSLFHGIYVRIDRRLSRISANKVIKVYPAFREFYGMEDVIEQVVSYFRRAAQGLEKTGARANALSSSISQ